MKSVQTSVCILLFFMFILRMSLGMFQTAGLKNCTSYLYNISLLYFIPSTPSPHSLCIAHTLHAWLSLHIFIIVGPVVICIAYQFISHVMNARITKLCIHASSRPTSFPNFDVCADLCVSFLQGERLRIPPNKCCPECISLSQGSCQHEGLIYGVSEKCSSANPC